MLFAIGWAAGVISALLVLGWASNAKPAKLRDPRRKDFTNQLRPQLDALRRAESTSKNLE
jgi:hypothetical protein